ncbi:NUDIX hydrolase [Thermocoleostomius sinensis]|uniref:NUDIX hydrolase n=1 Tax=Thermocoleostomius sinensis A174 TaxID=2016057 RepID=A0A9E8ZEW9_9CYAN|nr:NUDIX hydrolase [Thermocoleostomius sinensis]WAL61762.1 NUDIX hydrolase [Thermocoleostomius sinensis A174]
MQSITTSCPQVAIAILYQNHQFLLQLRDDVPYIRYPGQWAFFGGHLEPGEYPHVAMHRELLEEIEYEPPHITYFRSYAVEATNIIRHVFYAPLVVNPSCLVLHEGIDRGLATIEDIRQGWLFSEELGQPRPLAAPHRQILLDFLQSGIHYLQNDPTSQPF